MSSIVEKAIPVNGTPQALSGNFRRTRQNAANLSQPVLGDRKKRIHMAISRPRILESKQQPRQSLIICCHGQAIHARGSPIACRLDMEAPGQCTEVCLVQLQVNRTSKNWTFNSCDARIRIWVNLATVDGIRDQLLQILWSQPALDQAGD